MEMLQHCMLCSETENTFLCVYVTSRFIALVIVFSWDYLFNIISGRSGLLIKNLTLLKIYLFDRHGRVMSFNLYIFKVSSPLE